MKTIKYSAIFYLTLGTISAYGMRPNDASPVTRTATLPNSAATSPVFRSVSISDMRSTSNSPITRPQSLSSSAATSPVAYAAASRLSASDLQKPSEKTMTTEQYLRYLLETPDECLSSDSDSSSDDESDRNSVRLKQRIKPSQSAQKSAAKKVKPNPDSDSSSESSDDSSDSDVKRMLQHL